MSRNNPLLFEVYPGLKGKVPWVPILSNVPTAVERLRQVEKHLGIDGGELWIKRDDKDHHIYAGNKLRKFEFIFGRILKKKKKGVITIGGYGSNHCLACAIISKFFNLKCELFFFHQPLTWHVQRSLLLYDYFKAKLHFNKGIVGVAFNAIAFKIFHPKYYAMLPGGSLFFAIGSPLGIIGFINAVIELKEQIHNGRIEEPDVIFVAAGTCGTAAGLIAGCKLLGMKTRVYAVAVSMDWIVNRSTIMKNANKALKYLRRKDKTIPNIHINENDFELIEGYLGSEYGVKTKRGQFAVDKVMELEGKEKDFKLETTYTGKAMAAVFDFFSSQENKNKKVLFWNTYNSNDLTDYLKETKMDFSRLPKKFHKFYKEKTFQCWQITDCPDNIKYNCPAYLNSEYRFWKITECKLDPIKSQKAIKYLREVIRLEES